MAWQHGSDWRSPVSLRAQIRSTAAVIELFERKIATMAAEHPFQGILTGLPKSGGGEFGKYSSLPALNDPRIDCHAKYHAIGGDGYPYDSGQSVAFFDISLAHLGERLHKILQVICIGGLLVCAGSLVVSKISCDASKFLSFIMSLAPLVEPVQGVGKAYDELKQG